MRKICFIICLLLTVLQAETLFQVKDSQDRVVLDVSSDGLRVLNQGDTVMVISSSEIKAVIDDSKALSRSFTVATSTSAKGLYNALEVNTGSTTMSAGDGEYTNFSPKNIFLGLNAGASVTIGDPYAYSGLYNLFIGNHAGQSLTSGYFNTYTGYQAGNSSTIATHNSFYGYQAGMNNTTGSYNTAIGFQAGYEMSTGYNNNVMGYRAGYLTSSGHDNVFIGTNAGYSTSTGDYNVALGFNTGFSLNDGESNIFMGNESGYSNTSGSNNLFLGFQSGYNTSVGNNNIFMGYQAGKANTTGNDNQFMGYMSGQKNTTGSNSMFLGWQSGQNNTTGYENLFVGYTSGNSNVSGFGNVLLGTYSGKNFTTGNENVMIGRGAGAFASTSASNNVFIGSYAGYGNGSNTGNVFIGYKVGYNNVGSNKLMIDNDIGASSTTSLIYGDFYTNALKINGTLNVTGSTDIDNYLSLYAGTAVNEFSTDGSMAGNSDYAVPTERAVRSYVLANKDNLGNHTANQNIRLNGYYLSNDGGNEGVYVDTGGDVGIGTNSPGSNRLKVINSASGIAGAAGYFESTYSTGIGLVAEATSTDAALYVAQKHTSGGNIAKFASWYGGTWHESIVLKNSGGIVANNLSSGTGTALVLTSGNEIVKYSSSKKYKKDIETLVVDKEKFMKLRAVDFVWNEKSASEGKKDKGLIAEEVESIDTELAVYNAEGTIEGVDYQKINIMLLKVVQEQQIAIEELEKRLEVIERAQQ